MKKRLLFLAFSCFITAANAQNDPSATPGDTGTVTFTYQGATVTYTTVRGDDGMIWIQQNLGAGGVATSASDPNSYGHYFQWGRWDDDHQLQNSSTMPALNLTFNDPSGIPNGDTNFLTGNNPSDWWSNGNGTDTWSDAPPSSINGTDPCAAISPGWHMVSQSEFANAVTLEGITDVASAFASNLKLSAAGQREPTSGIMQNVGTYGQYWTSTPSGIYAKAVSIQPTAINANDDALRSYGAPVRCLTSCTGVFPPTTITGPDTVCQNTISTYAVPAVNNANNYSWTFPTGWTVVGSDSGNVIVVMASGTGGAISVMAENTCDTSTAVTFNVVVNPAPVPVITATGNVLSTGTFTTYQWLHEDTVLTGATNSTYTATDSGDYHVIVTDSNGCSDTSAVFNLSLSVETVTGTNNIQIFPNPAVDVINISSPVAVNAVIYSIDGRTIIEQQNAKQISTRDLAPGLYQIRLSDKQGNILRIQKLLVAPR